MPIRWYSKARVQYSDTPLYGSQQLTVGGASSVRGFHSVSVAGDNGYYWQNSIIMDGGFDLAGKSFKSEYTLGYDMGSVRSIRDGLFEGELRGATVGARFAHSPWALGLTVAKPLSISGDGETGPSHTTATLALDF